MKEQIQESDSELFEESEIKLEMHQGFMLSPFLYAVVADIVSELARVYTKRVAVH